MKIEIRLPSRDEAYASIAAIGAARSINGARPQTYRQPLSALFSLLGKQPLLMIMTELYNSLQHGHRTPVRIP